VYVVKKFFFLKGNFISDLPGAMPKCKGGVRKECESCDQQIPVACKTCPECRLVTFRLIGRLTEPRRREGRRVYEKSGGGNDVKHRKMGTSWKKMGAEGAT